MPAPVQIIAWGNRGRRDDGVALVLADELQALFADDDWVIVQKFHQLAPELVHDLGGSRLAIFIDAAVGQLGDGFAINPIAPAESADLGSHHVPPDALLALGQALGLSMPQAYQVAIHAQNTSYGDELSAPCKQAMYRAKRAVIDLVANFHRRAVVRTTSMGTHSTLAELP
jgi:hydrogenase maturation protease